MVEQGPETEWGVEALQDRLEAGEEFFVFDVRNEDEFSSWQIEGRGPLPTVNVPYYEMLGLGEFDDVVDSFEAYLAESWVEKLPRDKTIQVICRSGQRAYYATRLPAAWIRRAQRVRGMLSRAYASFFLQEGPIE